jgi:rSAM/selenodomain-associated transferase 2
VKVSVIIPALNEAARIRDSVRLAWLADADEVVVTDGGSTDETADIAQSLNCRFVAARRGRASQQNAAAAIATGDVLLFLHADNWLAPGASGQVRQVLADGRVSHGAFRQRIEAGELGYRALEWGNAQRVRWLGLPYGDQGIFVRREVFQACGGFPEVAIMEDLILGKILRHKAWPVLLPGPLHVDPRRWRQHGIVRQTLRNWSLLAGYAFGVSPERLARSYMPHREVPTDGKADPTDERQA